MTAPTLDLAKVEAFGLEAAPLANYVNESRKIASEYVLKYDGKKRRVYSGTNRGLFVIVKGHETPVPDEVCNMFLYGKYSELTPVAASVTLV
jgi:hypothetical protein